jgi:diadenosine tetraphosphate (Ap4A) HIT family hydrolase
MSRAIARRLHTSSLSTLSTSRTTLAAIQRSPTLLSNYELYPRPPPPPRTFPPTTSTSQLRSFSSQPSHLHAHAKMAANADPNCIFCKIIAGDIPSFKLAETEKLLAFLDIQPLSRGHAVRPLPHPLSLPAQVLLLLLALLSKRSTDLLRLSQLVIPKHHGRLLTDIPDEYLTEILPVVKKLAVASGAENWNCLQNNGRGAHQEVDHVSSDCDISFVWFSLGLGGGRREAIGGIAAGRPRHRAERKYDDRKQL